MSTCLPQNSKALGNNISLAPSWHSAAEAVFHRPVGRLQRLLTAWRARRRFEKEVHGLSERLLRDTGLEVEGRRANLTSSWRGLTPR